MTFDLDLWPWLLTSFSGRRLKNMIFMLGLDLWPTTLTFNPIKARVKVNLHAKNQGRRSNGLAMRAQTDRRTDTQTHGTNKGTLTIFYVRRVLRQHEVGPDKKKNYFWVFTLFFPPTLPKGGYFFITSVVILLKNGQNMLKLFLFSRHEPASEFFFLFPPTSPKNHCQDPLNIEYSLQILSGKLL